MPEKSGNRNESSKLNEQINEPAFRHVETIFSEISETRA